MNKVVYLVFYEGYFITNTIRIIDVYEVNNLKDVDNLKIGKKGYFVTNDDAKMYIDVNFDFEYNYLKNFSKRIKYFIRNRNLVELLKE